MNTSGSCIRIVKSKDITSLETEMNQNLKEEFFHESEKSCNASEIGIIEIHHGKAFFPAGMAMFVRHGFLFSFKASAYRLLHFLQGCTSS